MVFDIRYIQEADNTALAQTIRNVFDEFDAPKQGTVYSDPTTDNLHVIILMVKKTVNLSNQK
ncbi:MAG: hypothetical protein LBS09_04420 [Bacteroidales bacterium]|nr:hypothetical protein [Bacteroidales bacterium]